MNDTALVDAPTGRGRRPMSERRRHLQRLEISRAAIALFRERGVAGTTGEDIADAVGLSARTLWRYFRSKESCVEPLLSGITDTFVDTLRRWPPGVALSDHIARDHHLPDHLSASDGEATLAVVAMSRHEPALRAIWLVVHERVEPVLAEVVADRLGRSPDDLEVRVQGATLGAALRLTSEDLAADVAAGLVRPEAEGLARLSAAVRAATHGVLGDTPSSSSEH